MIMLKIYFRVTCRGITVAESFYMMEGEDKIDIRRKTKERLSTQYRPTGNDELYIRTSFKGYYFR